MLTIALNEYGDFHHLGQQENSLKHIHFITGIVYESLVSRLYLNLANGSLVLSINSPR